MWRVVSGGIGLLSNLEVQGNYAGNGSAQRYRRFAGQGFAKDLDAAGSGSAVDHVDLGQWNIGKLFVFPKDGRRRHEQADVKAIVAALAIEDGDELVEPGRPACAAEGEATGGAVESVAVSDEDAQCGAARDLVGNADGGFFDAGGTPIRMQEYSHPQGFAGSGFALFEPGAIDSEGLAAGNTFDAKRDALDLRRSEEHTSELQSHSDLVCRLLLEKKKTM